MDIDTSDALEQSAERVRPPNPRLLNCAVPTQRRTDDWLDHHTSSCRQLPLRDCVAQSVDETAVSQHAPPIRAAYILITAITDRIAQQRLTAAQTASALHLTGPRATRLLLGDADEFSLDELACMLPALDLTIEVVNASHRQPGRSQAFKTNH